MLSTPSIWPVNNKFFWFNSAATWVQPYDFVGNLSSFNSFFFSCKETKKNKRSLTMGTCNAGMYIARPTFMASFVAQGSSAHPSSLVDLYPSSLTYSWILGTLNLHPLLQDGLVNLLEAISKRLKMRTLLKKTLALMMPRDLSTSRQQLLNPSTVEEIDTSTNRDSIPMAHYQDGGK